MAYDAQGHRLTTYRGETGYWSDPDESGEPFFIRATAVASTANPSTAMQIVQSLQAQGIDPSFATTAQLEEARKAVGAPPVPASQVISATSGGMAAPSNMVTVAGREPTEMDPAGSSGFSYDPSTLAQIDGRWYATDSTGQVQYINNVAPWGGILYDLKEGANNQQTKDVVSGIQANQGGGSFFGDMGELASDFGSALKEAAPGIALVGGAGLLGGAFPSIYSGIGGAGTVAGGAGETALAGGTTGALGADAIGAALPSAITAAPDAIAAIDAAMTATGATTATEAAAALGYGSTEAMIGAANPAWLAPSAVAGAAGGALANVAAPSVVPSAAAPSLGLPQVAAGASLAGTAASLGGGDSVGSDWATQGLNPDGSINYDVMNGGLLPTDPNTGLVLPNFQASPSGTGNQALDDFSMSNSGLLKLGLPLAGAALGGLSGGSSPAGTTTTVNDLPDWLKPYVTGNLDAAKAYMAANPQNNSLIDPARSELNKTIAGDYLNANPANAFYSGAQNYVNPGIAGMQAGASGAYVGQNPADAGYRAAQGYTNPGIDLLRPAATGAYVGQNPSDPYYRQAANYTNTSMDYLRPTAEGKFLNANPYIDAMYAKARDAVGTGIDSRFSRAGRYGSGAHQGVLGTTFDNLATDIYGNNYATERANMLSAGGTLISADQAQQAARLAGASGLSGNYQNDRATQLVAAGNLGTLSQAEQAARLAGTAGLSGNYNQDRTLQYNYGQAMTAVEQAQQAARLAGAAGLGANWNAARTNQTTAAGLAPGFTADAATAPFAAFNAFGNLTKGLGVSQTSSPYFTNPVGGALSGALAGYGLSKAFG